MPFASSTPRAASRVSAASERLFGYTPDEMIGKTMLDMVVSEDRAKAPEAAEAIMPGR